MNRKLFLSVPLVSILFLNGSSLSRAVMQGGLDARSADSASSQRLPTSAHPARLLFVFDFADFMCPLCLESFLEFYRILPAAYKTRHSAGIVVFQEEADLEDGTRFRIVQKKLNGFITANGITFPVWVDSGHVFDLVASEGSALLLFDGQRQTIKRYAFPLTRLRIEEILSFLDQKL